jgi:thioredoxin reductase (NADPH)
LDFASQTTEHDLILIGAGPCGLAAAADFKQAGLDYVHLETERLAQTIYNFPRKMRLYTKRAGLTVGDVPFGPRPDESPSREEYLEYLRLVVRQLELNVQTYTESESIISQSGGHVLQARRRDGTVARYAARNIVVASGGYYTPVLLGIPGEDQPNVSHYFRSDLPVRGKRILIVGGRNSAIEAATILAQKHADVVLAYRGARLSRKNVKPWILPPLDAARKEGRIRVLYRTVPTSIRDHLVELKTTDAALSKIEVDRVFLLTGYGPDYEFLRRAGIPFHKRNRRPLFNPRTLESRVPGIFLCGTVVLKWNGEKASIENTRDHGRVILENMN